MTVAQRSYLPWVILALLAGGLAYFGVGSAPNQDPPPEPQVVDASETSAEPSAAVTNDTKDLAVEGGTSPQTESGQDPRPAPSGSGSNSKNEPPKRLNLSGTSLEESKPALVDGQYRITFDHIKLDLQPDQPFEESLLTDQVRTLDGQEVRLRGFIRPSFRSRGLKSFIFVRDDKECCFGPGSALHDSIIVRLKRGAETNFTTRPVTVAGRFQLKELKGPDGGTMAIYRMTDAVVD